MPENMLRAEKNITEAKMLEFGDGKEKYASKESFGNKGSILIDMSSMGVPVPPGFVLNVSVCEDYFKNSSHLPDDVPNLLRQGILFIESVTGKVFWGSPPLMVSVRSGAAASMPGSMETLLNVGLSRNNVRFLIARTGNPSFTWDSYRKANRGIWKNSVFPGSFHISEPAEFRNRCCWSSGRKRTGLHGVKGTCSEV